MIITAISRGELAAGTNELSQQGEHYARRIAGTMLKNQVEAVYTAYDPASIATGSRIAAQHRIKLNHARALQHQEVDQPEPTQEEIKDIDRVLRTADLKGESQDDQEYRQYYHRLGIWVCNRAFQHQNIAVVAPDYTIDALRAMTIDESDDHQLGAVRFDNTSINRHGGTQLHLSPNRLFTIETDIDRIDDMFLAASE